MQDLQTLINAFGPTGAIIALGFYLVKTVLPWLHTFFVSQAAALNRIAEAMESLEAQHQVFGQQLSAVRGDMEETQIDIARIYERLGEPQPSRRKPPIKPV